MRKSVSILILNADSYTRLIGDDGVIKIWNIDTLKCIETLSNENWGQVTALSWLTVNSPANGSLSLAIGTGRGFLTLCPVEFVQNKLVSSILKHCRKW